MISRSKLWLVPVAMLALATAIGAEEQQKQAVKKPAVCDVVGAEQTCDDHETAAISGICSQIDQARKSNDKAAMKKALDAAYDQLGSVKEEATDSSKRMLALHERLDLLKDHMTKMKENSDKMQSLFYGGSEFVIGGGG